MIVGVPKEIKADEYRVAMLPVGAEELTSAGHQVLIEAGAGQGSGIVDAQYASAGATIVASAGEIWAGADMIVKVKEPQSSEWSLLRPDQVVFTYFHFAADESLTRAIIDSGITAIAYETLRDPRGSLPLLTPMSEVAGRMSIQEGARFLERPQEGRGILLAGVPGVAPAEVAILGGGVVGSNAAKVAAGLGANVRILDVNLDRLRYLDDIMPPNVTTLYSDRHTIRESIERADLVIGAVLITGAGASPDPAPGPRADEDRHGDRRCGHRPGRVYRDQPAHHPPSTHVCGGWSRSLLRDQHARRRGPDEHLCALQRYTSLCPATCQEWLEGSGRNRSRSRRGGEHRSGARHQPGGRRDLRPALQPAGRPSANLGRNRGTLQGLNQREGGRIAMAGTDLQP